MSKQHPPVTGHRPSPLEATDRELVHRTRLGDSEAVALLWRRHYGPVCRWARTMTVRFEPDDLASEAFARLLQAIGNGRGPEGAVRPYLRAVVRNLCMEWSRRTVPSVAMEGFDDLLVADDPYPAVDAALDCSAAARAFRSLPQNWQRVLWLAHVEGLAPREMAAAFGMSANAVSALRFRAVHGFRRAYAATDTPSEQVA